MESHSVWPFVIGFYLVSCFLGSFVLYVSEFHSFLCLVDIWDVPTFWLSGIMLLWRYKFLCGHMFSVLLGVYLGVELRGHMVTLFNILMSSQTVFQSSCIILYFHRQCLMVPIFPYPSHYLLLSCFFFITTKLVLLSSSFWLLIFHKDICMWFLLWNLSSQCLLSWVGR